MWRNSILEVAPKGGPVEGGTTIFITGRKNPSSGAYPFVDLGDARCKFHGGATSVATVINRSLLHCVTPPCESSRCADDNPPPGYATGGLTSVPVEVTLDGVYYSTSGRRFTFYEPSRVAVSSLTPRGGPLAGGTRLRLVGAPGGLRVLGGVRVLPNLPYVAHSHRLLKRLFAACALTRRSLLALVTRSRYSLSLLALVTRSRYSLSLLARVTRSRYSHHW